MPSYNKQISISTYTVDKSLIEHLEEYFKKNVSEILNVESSANLNRDSIDFSVTFHDSHGIEKFTSITDYKFPLFRNDTKGVSLELALYACDKQLKITLRFGDEQENSDLAISLTDENAREKVSAIEQGIFLILNHNKNLNRIVYPNSFVNVILFLGYIACGVLTLDTTYPSKGRFALGALFWTGIFFSIIPKYFKDYSSFDTNKQKQLDKWFTWLITGLFGFVLFSTLLSSVRKNLFGF